MRSVSAARSNVCISPTLAPTMLTETDLLPVTSPTANARSQVGSVRHVLAVGTALVLVTLVMVGLAVGAGAPVAAFLDSSAEGITTPVTTGHALSQITTGITNDLHEAYTSNPLYWDPHKRDHIKLSITPSNEGCGASGKELIRPFYVNSGAQSGAPNSFQWCEGGTCHLSLEMGAPCRQFWSRGAKRGLSKKGGTVSFPHGSCHRLCVLPGPGYGNSLCLVWLLSCVVKGGGAWGVGTARRRARAQASLASLFMSCHCRLGKSPLPPAVTGGDTLHHDVGYLKLRGCPVKEGYTVPYLRVMKVLMGSYDVLHLGWGACDAGETNCEVGDDVTLSIGDCKTFAHPSRPAMKYDLCYQGPGHF